MTSYFLLSPGSANIPQNRPQNSLHEKETLRATHRECPNVQAIGCEYFMFGRCLRQTLYWPSALWKLPINARSFYSRLLTKSWVKVLPVTFFFSNESFGKIFSFGIKHIWKFCERQKRKKWKLFWLTSSWGNWLEKKII